MATENEQQQLDFIQANFSNEAMRLSIQQQLHDALLQLYEQAWYEVIMNGEGGDGSEQEFGIANMGEM